MATRALTPVAQRQSRANVSARKAPGHARDWRQVLQSQDAEAIWQQLSILVRTIAPGNPAECDQITQELFLNLIAADRISHYLENNYSDSAIRADLLEALGE
jgi:hypothetical protein